MAESFRLYRQFVAIALRARLQYRSDFLIGIISVILLNIVNLTLIWVLLSRFTSLKGWSYWEVAMLYSMYLTSHSIYAVFFWHLTTLEDDIISGRFDQYLVRPCSPFVQFLGRELNYMGVGDFLIATAVFIIAYQNLNLYWTAGQWGFYGLALLAGVVIETSIALLISITSFWTGRSMQLYRLSLRFSILTQQYPIDMFGRWYQLFVTGLLPVAFMNYYPLSALLGKHNGLEIPLLGWLSPLVALLLLFIVSRFWRIGLRAYASSGS